MINKYQQGGAAPQQGGGILAQIQQLPQEQQQQLMQAFAQWAQQKGVDIQQLQSNPAALEQALGQFMQEMQAQQAQAAKHGAKLRFIKGLKHQCEADEHLEYFAKGGAIGCNCVKNKQGGKAEPKGNALEQFKAKKGINLKKDKCGGKMKKHQIGGTIETLRQSLGLEKKNLNKFQGGGLVERTDNTRVASGRPQQVNNKIPYGAGKGPAADSPMRLFNDPYVNMGLMAMGPMVSRFKPGETPPQHINGVKQAPQTLQDMMNYLQQSPKTSEAPRVMGIGVHGLARRTGKSPQEVIRIMSQKFGNPQIYPKALDNSEPAYGWTFENPDHYRQALQLFNLK